MKHIKQRVKNGTCFGVDFVKKDGSIRRMNARMGVKCHLRQPEGTHKRTSNPNLVVVWDRNAERTGAYRSFKLDTVLSLRHGGMTYYPVQLDGKTYFNKNELTNLL